MNLITYESLAAEARSRWPSIDPARLERALEIVKASNWNVQPARRDENEQPIAPSLEVLIVHGRHGWYVVRRHSCTCPDSRSGHVCKHRLAAWLYREIVTRPIKEAYEEGCRAGRKSIEQLKQELGF